jgi:hypothetical protein
LATTGSTFGSAPNLRYTFSPGCPCVQVLLGLDRLSTTTGSRTVDPATTTTFELVARHGRDTRVLDRRTVIAGRVVNYRTARRRSRPT